MSDHLQQTIANSLAMSYGSHVNPPQGGKDWKAAENLMPIIATEVAAAKAEALREAADEAQGIVPGEYQGQRFAHWLRRRADTFDRT